MRQAAFGRSHGRLLLMVGLACALGLPGYGQDLRRPGLGRAPVGFVDGWRPGMVVRFGAPFDPNDEYFAPFVDGSYLGQWNLENNLDLSELGITARIDANIRGAWDRGLTGAGVTIGIVDDGLEWDHPDLVDNYNAADSYDFGNDTPDPYPFRDNQYTDSGLGFPLVTSNGDNHGTVVAGVAAGVGGNGIGLTGAAPNAGIAGLRASFDPADELVQDQQLADAPVE